MNETYAHRNIKSTLTAITPMELSLKKMGQSDEKTIDGCRGLYAFFVNLFTDMLENPKEYLVYPGEYESLMQDQPKLAGARWQSAPDHDSIKSCGDERERLHNYEVEARNKTNYAILFYQKYLFEISKAARLLDNKLIIEKEVYQNIKIGGAKYLRKSDMPARIKAFSRAGLIISEDMDNVVIEYPENDNMLPVMLKLSREAEKNKEYGYFNFTCLNFNQMAEKYKPNYDDIVRVLDPDTLGMANDLHQYAKDLKILPKPYLFWKMTYQYKGQVVFRFSADTEGGKLDFGNLNLTIVHCMDCKDIHRFNDLLEREEEDVKQFCIDHLNDCFDCGKCKNPPGSNGIPIKLLGKNYRVCGWYAGCSILNPKPEQLEIIKKFIKIRKDFLDSV